MLVIVNFAGDQTQLLDQRFLAIDTRANEGEQVPNFIQAIGLGYVYGFDVVHGFVITSSVTGRLPVPSQFMNLRAVTMC